jgi:hypothetical protein
MAPIKIDMRPAANPSASIMILLLLLRLTPSFPSSLRLMPQKIDQFWRFFEPAQEGRCPKLFHLRAAATFGI